MTSNLAPTSARIDEQGQTRKGPKTRKLEPKWKSANTCERAAWGSSLTPLPSPHRIVALHISRRMTRGIESSHHTERREREEHTEDWIRERSGCPV